MERRISPEVIDTILIFFSLSLFILLEIIEAPTLYIYLTGLIVGVTYLAVAIWTFFYARKEKGFNKAYYLVLSIIGIVVSIYAIVFLLL